MNVTQAFGCKSGHTETAPAQITRTLAPGYRAQAVIFELVRPARLGQWFTVQEVIEAEAGLCRVQFDGQPGRTCLATVDPSLADTDQAPRLVRYVNASAVAHIISGFGECSTRKTP